MLVKKLDDLNQNQFKKLSEIKSRKANLTSLKAGQSLIQNLSSIEKKTANQIKSKLSQMKINVGTGEEDTTLKFETMKRRKFMTKSSTPKVD